MKQESLNDGKDKGWVRIWRKLLDNPIFKDSEAVHLFIYLLLKANHKQNKFLFNQREMAIDRGQMVTGIERMSKDTGLTHRQIRTRLALLKNIGILTRKTTNRFSIITICNYDHYQSRDNEERQAERQADDKQTTTNKNVKNVKKKEYVEGSDELRLASLLLEDIRKNQPTFKEPNLQTWAKEIDLMIRRDGRTPDRIEEVIRWCQADGFWWKNISSASKVRKQFDRLEAEMISPKGKVSPKEMPRVEYEDLTGGGRT